MDYRILGPLEVWAGDRPVPLGGEKQRALLAILLLHANESVSVDGLIDGVWGERPPATAVKTTQGYIARLRRAARSRPVTARRRRAGLKLWRGPPLADFTYEPFAQAAIAQAEELRLSAIEERVEADLALEGHGELVASCRRWLSSP